MGEPKLLLPLGGRTVISRVLSAVNLPQVVCRCVVVRRGDDPLRDAVELEGGWSVCPSIDPPDMRSSVQFALEQIRQQHSPKDHDGWMLIPADHPVLNRNIVELLVENWSRRSSEILVPRYGNRRGHPTIFPWSLAGEVNRIPHDCGLNWLLNAYSTEVNELALEDDAALIDLDTPADYERLKHVIAQTETPNELS